jgi:hypothetical protein
MLDVGDDMRRRFAFDSVADDGAREQGKLRLYTLRLYTRRFSHLAAPREVNAASPVTYCSPESATRGQSARHHCQRGGSQLAAEASFDGSAVEYRPFCALSRAPYAASLM